MSGVIEEEAELLQIVSADRCICIHSTVQFVDLALQSIAYRHGLLPYPMITLQRAIPKNCEKTMEGFEKIREQLKAAFRSHRRRALSDVAILVGSSPIKPKYTYRIPIHLCDDQDSEIPSQEDQENQENLESTPSKCGSPCSDLSEKEKRSINRKLFEILPPFLDAQSQAAAATHRIFVLLNGEIELISEEMDEYPLDDSTLMDSALNLCLRHEECSMSKQTLQADTFKWLRINPFITGGKL
ncbi:hypothetical protein WR25_23549 [Diploscapter pachys]|uniref:Uncharacterized protein n=1 Tax=Diploscapter pachys TaxID=2018661 RepID=A0A2A2LID8_9BILA|nr:hypothetical protein WR25_23549 [Diploscapter pachys]